MTTNKRRYTSVSGLLQDVAPDLETRVATEKRISSRRLVKQLLARRAVKGLSQQEIAQKLDCTQSRISKLESSSDDDIRLGDLRTYAEAVGCEFGYGIVPQDMKPVDKVKGHVFAIKTHMDDLSRLAQTDETIVTGVANFFFELFVNFARLVGSSAKLLPLAPDESPYFQVQIDQMSSLQENSEIVCCTEADTRLAATP